MNTMSPDQWHKAVDDYCVEMDRLKGRTAPAPREHTNTYSFPISHSEVTEDLIRLFCAGIGNPNPLYTDAAYAKTTRWGGLIAPPYFEVRISEAPYFPPPLQVPGWLAALGSDEPLTRGYFRPYRPGDVVHAIDEYLGMEEVTRAGEPIRRFNAGARRTYLDRRMEPISYQELRGHVRAIPPDRIEESRDLLYQGQDRERRRFSAEELDAIHQGYEEELAGKWRRGAEVRYWDDVEIGDGLHPIAFGPYDIHDAVAYFGNIGYAGAHAVKWGRMKHDRARLPVDPETGEVHHVVDLRLSDAIARASTADCPYAQAFGLGLECSIGHCVTNWAGDDGFLKKIDSWMNGWGYHGEVFTIRGSVADKRIEDGEHLVDIDLTMTTNNGHRLFRSRATVRLLSRSG